MNKEHDAQTAKTLSADRQAQDKTTKYPVENLRIYQTARTCEDLVHDLVRALPETEFYKLGNALRRSSAACAHYISQAHNEYSFAHKIESFHNARHAAETTIGLLESYEEQKYGKTGKLAEEYTSVIKQTWGMIKWLRARQEQKQVAQAIAAKDELVAARA